MKSHDWVKVSVTRLVDLLYFWQLFKAFDNNYFTQIAHILGNFWKGGKIFHFSTEIIHWATFIDIWRFFTGHTGQGSTENNII